MLTQTTKETERTLAQTTKEKEQTTERTLAQTIKDKKQTEQKLELVSRLVSAQPTNKGLALYKQTLENDFMQFAQTTNALGNEARALKKLQNIQNELELIAAYPQLHTKSVIAVGGGFSAGKSEFISSLFTNTAVKLPVGIQPTTAIPAYVLNSSTNELIGCTPKGGVVNLHEIDPQFHEKLSHDFMESFPLNLKEIMPFMILGTKMGYAHTCFIDTPGYNPAGGSHTAHDVQVAKEFLEKASALLWIVITENGTLPQSDIDFLQKLELENKKLYIVINKADLNPPCALKEIAEEVQDKLDDEDIQIAGISVYSAIRKKEYLTKTLKSFLHGCDASPDTHKKIIEKLREVYQQYKDAIEQTIRKKKKQKKNFQQLKSQVAKINLSSECDAAVESIEKMQRDNMLSTSEEEKNLKDLKTVMRKFGDSVKAIFPKSGDDSDWAIFIEILNRQHLEETICQLMNAYGPNVDLNHLDVSNVTDMSGLFGAIYDERTGQCVKNSLFQAFNGDISRWNVGNVTNMQGMFKSSQFNGNISGWDVSNVTNMREMFTFSQFNRDLSGWDVSNVQDMVWMFQNSQFNGDISGWNVSNVHNMGCMFSFSQFNGDLSGWNVSNVRNMQWMFANSQFNGDISGWDVSNVRNMQWMFANSQFNGDISGWDVSNVRNMQWMFANSQFSRDLSRWNVSRETNTFNMFVNSPLQGQELGGGGVINLSGGLIEVRERIVQRAQFDKRRLRPK